MISSLMTMIHGITVNVDRLSLKYKIDYDLGRSIAPLHSVTSMQMVEAYFFLPPEQVATELPPAGMALATSMLPNEASMEWLARKFKLSAVEMLGLYAIMHGPTGRHYEALVAITVELMNLILTLLHSW